jgi:ankyrin repeat protein
VSLVTIFFHIGVSNNIFSIGGNSEAVEICLKNGSKIDDQQDDLSTPVHLASSQGSLEILKLLFNCQSELKSKVIRMADVQGMTPLHR